MKYHSPFFFYILLIILSLRVYFYRGHKREKRKSNKRLNVINNQIYKEQIIQKHYNKEQNKMNVLEKDINQKFVTLRTDVMMIDFELREIFSL